MKLDTKVEKISDTRVKVSSEIDENSVSNELNKQYKVFANKYRFPGFRAGKAPRPVVDAAVGKESVYIEATQNLIDDAYRQIINDENLRPVGNPDFSEGENTELVEDKKSYKIEFQLEVAPEIELTNYDKIQGFLPPIEATEEDIDEQMKVYSQFVAGDDKQPLEINDKNVKEKLGYDSVEDMREQIGNMVKAEKENMVPRLKEDVVCLKLRDRVKDEPSEELVEFVNTALLTDLFESLQSYGTTFDQYLKSRGYTSEEFYEDVKKQAYDEAKTRMGLDAWAKHFKLEATDEDIENEFKKAGITDVAKEKKEWIKQGKLWRLVESVTRVKAIENAVEGAKWEFDAEKAKHQFDTDNKSSKVKKSSKKTKENGKKEDKEEKDNKKK